MLHGLKQNGTGGKRYANFAAFKRVINRLDWSRQAIPRHNAPLPLEQPIWRGVDHKVIVRWVGGPRLGKLLVCALPYVWLHPVNTRLLISRVNGGHLSIHCHFHGLPYVTGVVFQETSAFCSFENELRGRCDENHKIGIRLGLSLVVEISIEGFN